MGNSEEKNNEEQYDVLVSAFNKLGKDCEIFLEAFAQTISPFVKEVLMYYEPVLKEINRSYSNKLIVKAAREEGYGRIAYLAEHGKKYRTRKKNLNRIRKELKL